jgi:uncharacterized protein (DUF1697 family)
MTNYVAFLGGINVGGHRVTMDRLRATFEDLGFDAVSTFIASGNVLFTAKGTARSLERKIEGRLEEELDYGVPTFVRTAKAVRAAVALAPFGSVSTPFTSYVVFLRAPPTPAAATAAAELSNAVDTFEVRGTELHWRVRGGLTDSLVKPTVLARALGVASTTRNVKSLTKLLDRL